VLAVSAAVLTSVFLIFPVFLHTSFIEMGTTPEMWVLFAMLIMTNCKKPLESALKTFVFFLISQPLIYLLQVPFTWQGWGIFQYYKHWFILTLCTFPAAYIGWYIRKKNWLSLLILMPVLILLAHHCEDGLKHVIHQFPSLLIMVVFCILQILIYLYAFTEKLPQRLVGVLVPIAVIAVMLLMPKNVDFSSSQFLPDNPVLTESAEVAVDDTGIADISVSGTGEDSTVLVQAHAYGDTSFTIKDGDNEYQYNIRIYEDDLGTSQIDITSK
jgi:hypothetical protein